MHILLDTEFLFIDHNFGQSLSFKTGQTVPKNQE